jgi:lycopene beta-cyclase
MTNYPFSGGEKRVINIGTAGGQTKASSGYTFQFIQKHSARIIDALTKGEDPLLNKPFFEKRFSLYDRIFLNVLCKKKMRGDELFADTLQEKYAAAGFKIPR